LCHWFIKGIALDKLKRQKEARKARKKLEDILRDANKWDEISTLDTHAMEQSIITNRWDKKLISKLKKLLTIDIKKHVSLSKIQEKEK
jgi:hypothetical protein